MNKIRQICTQSLPYLSVASATMAKLFMLVQQPLNLSVWILNFALLITLTNKSNIKKEN